MCVVMVASIVFVGLSSRFPLRSTHRQVAWSFPVSQSCAVAKIEKFWRAINLGRQNGRLLHWPTFDCLSTKTKLWKRLLWPAACIPSWLPEFFTFSYCAWLWSGLSPIIPSTPKCSSRHPSKVCMSWVIRFHPSYRLFSCLINHSTVSLTIPLGG